MQLNLGGKIRELRHRDERTQEAVAEALGVTPQAVSRWESGGSYPDMEMIPSIANYFGITIDELFGYQNDREVKIQGILEKTKAGIRSLGGFLGVETADLRECLEILREAAEEFPGEPRILIRLADTLYHLGWNKNDTSENTYCRDALSLYEKLLKLDISSEQRRVVVFNLIMLYQHLGDYERAKTLAEDQPSLILSREVLLSKTSIGEEKEQYQGELIIALMTELCCAIVNSLLAKTDLSASPYGKEIPASLITLFETIFQDGRCGTRHMDLRYLYLTLAALEARCEQDMEKALIYFDKAFDHHKEYCRISISRGYQYTAPLVAKVHLSSEWLQPVPEFFWKYYINMIPDVLKEMLRKNEKYAECFT